MHNKQCKIQKYTINSANCSKLSKILFKSEIHEYKPRCKKINDDLNALYGTVTPANLDVSQISRNSVQPTASRQLMQICMRNI